MTRRQKSLISVRTDNKNTDKKHKIEHSPNLPRKKTNRQKSPIPNGLDKVDSAPKSTSGPKTQNGNNINGISSELSKCQSAIKQVLTMKYVNALERLHLTFPAKCMQSLRACSEQHFRSTVSTIYWIRNVNVFHCKWNIRIFRTFHTRTISPNHKHFWTINSRLCLFTPYRWTFYKTNFRAAIHYNLYSNWFW